MNALHGDVPSSAVARAAEVTIRPLEDGDRDRLLHFGAALSTDDVLYFEDDYHSPEIIARLVNASKAEHWRQIVAVADDRIVGYSSVRRLPGWSSHVGTIRLIIHPDWRRSGLGTNLGRAVAAAAQELGVDKMIVEILEMQAGGQAIFERLGFAVEGRLSDHARDRQGQRHTLLVLAHHIR